MTEQHRTEIPLIENFHTIVFDFDGIFTNNKVFINQEGLESVQCDRADGLGINILKKYIKKKNIEIEIFILSKEKNKVVLSRSNKLDLDCKHGIDNKLMFLMNYLNQRFGENKISPKNLLYMGNDLNDLESIIYSGFSICPNDSHELIKKYSSITLNSNGGEGFVREAIELLIRLNELEYNELIEFI